MENKSEVLRPFIEQELDVMFFEFIHAWSKIIHCFFFYYRPRWTTVLGTKYKIGCILQYGYAVQRDLPLYGKVEEFMSS